MSSNQIEKDVRNGESVKNVQQYLPLALGLLKMELRRKR